MIAHSAKIIPLGTKILAFLIFLTLAGLFGWGCADDKKRGPDTSGIQPGLEVLRFEKDFFEADSNNLLADLPELKKKYSAFWDVFFYRILAEMPSRDTFPDSFYLDIHANPFLREVLDSVLLAYPDLSWISREMDQVMVNYRYFFRDTMPKTLISFISEYGVGACTIGADTLGIGLDMYLGSQYGGYNPQVFPAYIRAVMNRSYIVPHLAKVLAQQAVGDVTGDRMIDHLFRNGKVLYIMDQLLPGVPDSIKMEYTSRQMQWVRENETQIWSSFLTRDLLYSTRSQDYQKLVGPSPNAPHMPPEAPGQTANWIGWQIVKAYMKRYPRTTLPELAAMQNPQEFLETSRYRPR